MSADPNAETASGRKRRRDRGCPLFTERDRWLLPLVAEQYAISVNQLATLIGRKFEGAVWLRDRWLRAGWVESRKLAARGPSMIWLTREGVRVAQSPYPRWRPNVALATHIEAVTSVRLLLERQLCLGEWRCERELAQRLSSPEHGRPHLPDGVLETGDEQIAIEVELTLKSRLRLTQILAEVGQHYSQVWYFAAPPLERTLAALTKLSHCQNITVHPYPPRPGDLYA